MKVKSKFGRIVPGTPYAPYTRIEGTENVATSHGDIVAIDLSKPSVGSPIPNVKDYGRWLS